MPDFRDDSPKKQPFVRKYSAYADLGLRFAISIIGLTFLGHYLDGKLSTGPFLTVFGVFFGGFAGFYSIYRVVTDMEKKSKHERKNI